MDSVDSIFMHDMERNGDLSREDNAPAYEERTAFGFLKEQEREQQREKEEAKEEFVESVIEYHQDEVEAAKSSADSPSEKDSKSH